VIIVVINNAIVAVAVPSVLWYCWLNESMGFQPIKSFTGNPQDLWWHSQ